MKIAIISPYITTSFMPEKFYNIQVFGLAKELSFLGWNVDVYTTKKHGDPDFKEILLKNDKKIGIYYKKTIAIPIVSKLFQQPFLLINYRKINKNYDLIQVSEDFQLNTLYFSVLRFLKLVKLPLIIYQGSYKYSSNKIFGILWRLFDKVFGKIIRDNVNFVITKTTTAEQFMRMKGYPNIKTISVGVDIATFYPRERNIFREKMDLDNSIPLILYVGSIIPRRNIELLIEAMSIVTKHLKNAMLLLVGEGILIKNIKYSIENMHLEKNVKFFSLIPNKELPYVYSSADVFVLPSKEEIFGMVILESMACGTPVISTPTPGANNVISHYVNGIILENNTKEHLAKQILTILTNVNLSETLRENAEKTIKEKNNWSILAKDYNKVYLEVIESFKDKYNRNRFL